MLQTKKLKSHVASLLKSIYYELRAINLTWKGRHLVLALFASSNDIAVEPLTYLVSFRHLINYDYARILYVA